MLKIYIHPLAVLCTQEVMFKEFFNYVPMTMERVLENFQIVEKQEDADFNFIGQITDYVPYNKEVLEFAKNNSKNTIVDIDGDYFENNIPSEIKDCICIAGGPSSMWGLTRCMPRLQMSKTLKFINEKYDRIKVLDFKDKKREFFFQGQITTTHRALMHQVVANSGYPFVINSTNNGWGGMLSEESYFCSSYLEGMNNHLFSLSPRGFGGSTIRFIEACFFGNVPIVLGKDIFMGQGTADLSFVIKVEDYTNPYAIRAALDYVLTLSEEQLYQISLKSKAYYNEVVQKYFDNPTLDFINWLNRNILKKASI